jgi:hypothetical protein
MLPAHVDNDDDDDDDDDSDGDCDSNDDAAKAIFKKKYEKF